MKIYCQDPNYQAVNVFADDFDDTQVTTEFDGTRGSTLTIVPKTEGILKICDLKIFAKKVDDASMQEYALNLAKCQVQQVDC